MPRDKLTAREVELIRMLRYQGFSYRLIAEKFEVSKSCVAMICQFKRRLVVDVMGVSCRKN